MRHGAHGRHERRVLRSLTMRLFAARSVTYRWTLATQGVVLAALLLYAVSLALTDGRRFWFAVAIIVVGFVPFAYARLRAQRIVEMVLGAGARGRQAAALYTSVATLGDVIMVSQVMTARSHAAYDLLHMPGITWVGPVWFSAYALLLLGIGVGALARLAMRGARVLLRLTRISRSPGGWEETNVERRLFLRQAGLLGVGTPFIVSLSGVKLSYDFRVQEREIRLPNWPAALDGLRVAHLSDIHVGGTMNRVRLRHVAALTNDAHPDLVIHTGDFLTHRSGAFDEPLYEALASVRAPLGQWACLGNHDFDDAARLERRLRAAGVTTLRDRMTRLEVNGTDLEIGGLDFVFGRGDRLRRYATTLPAWAPRDGAPRLLLNHDPSAFALLPEGCADLVCSGHTHGGHIGVQLGPEHAITVVGLVGIPDQGLFERRDMRLFVTRCVGFYGYPMRLGIPPEISLLILRA
jgi:predicted MPP superfamily phosphohydrolase